MEVGMEAAASIPIAVGAHALKILNKWLENKEIAKAWYGGDVDDFTRSIAPPTRRFRETLSIAEINVHHVFTINREQWRLLIRRCLDKCDSWYDQRYDGECCWLPLYRAIKDPKNPYEVLKPAMGHLSSIGTIASLPAAQLDTWGLVVMAYANGGALRMREDRGSFIATFHARWFVLVIRQETLTSQTLAHIAPKGQGDNNRYIYSEDQWFRLYESGCSLDLDDHVLNWYQDPCRQANPPDDLVDDTLDEKIRRMIIDDQHLDKIKKKLRNYMCDCYDTWVDLERQNPLCEFITHHADLVKKNLLKAKLVSVDGARGSWFTEEMTAEDVFRYCKKSWLLVKEASRTRPLLGELVELHRVVLALHKLLFLCKRIPKQLSTCNTGDTLLLAGNVDNYVL